MREEEANGRRVRVASWGLNDEIAVEVDLGGRRSCLCVDGTGASDEEEDWGSLGKGEGG